VSAIIPDTIRELEPAYAVGALSLEEARVFEAALVQSPELQREVAEYREVGALLATTGEARPGSEVRDRLLRRVQESKRVPLARRSGRPLTWLMPVGLAATTLLAVGLGLETKRLSQELAIRNDSLATAAARLARREATLDALLTAQFELTVVQLTTSGTDAPGIQFFWNRRSNQGVLHAFRLPPTAPDKVYQLWLIPKGGAPVPSETFRSAPDGHALVEAFPLPIEGGFEAAAVTVEPEGGSRTPTMPIVLIGKVAGL
jgi:anti-sigma-K factor RskA